MGGIRQRGRQECDARGEEGNREKKREGKGRKIDVEERGEEGRGGERRVS